VPARASFGQQRAERDGSRPADAAALQSERRFKNWMNCPPTPAENTFFTRCFSADRPVYGSPSGRFCLGAALKPPLSEDAEHRVEGG
jgi:hypothetical protein